MRNIHTHTRWRILQAVKPIKDLTGTKSDPFDSKSHPVNVSCKKGLTATQAKYVYSKCKNKEVISSEQVYECENNDKPQLICN